MGPAGVKEGYRRREIKKAERGVWEKLMGSCSGSEAGARRRTWKREMLARREKNLQDGMQLFARWIAQARAACGGTRWNRRPSDRQPDYKLCFPLQAGCEARRLPFAWRNLKDQI